MAKRKIDCIDLSENKRNISIKRKPLDNIDRTHTKKLRITNYEQLNKLRTLLSRFKGYLERNIFARKVFLFYS